MSQPRVLIVEDELQHRLILEKILSDSYHLIFASSYQQAKKLIHTEQFDIVLLDIMLDEADGFQLCAEIKKTEVLKNKPIIFLSGRSEVNSKVLGFQLGADDYIVKPCEPLELRARLSAKIRKAKEQSEQMHSYIVGDMNFRWDRQILEIKGEARPIELTPLEFKLIYFLARHKGEPLTREQILAEVWGSNTNVLDRTVDTFVAGIRKKLGSRSKCIRSVHGVGYKFQIVDSPNQKVS